MRHLIRVMRKLDPTKKNTMTKTNTKTMTKTDTFREHSQRATLETCDLWDIWSGWGGDMTSPTKRPSKRDHRDFWQYWKCWHFWQLRTSIHCKFADLIISLIIFDKYKRGRYDLSETHIYNSDILYDCRLDKFDPNWKPLGSDISTSSPTNHKREKKTESCLKMFSEICPMFNFQTGCVCS